MHRSATTRSHRSGWNLSFPGRALRTIALSLALAASATTAVAQELTDDVQRLINKAKLTNERVGVSIVDLGDPSSTSQRVLAGINSAKAYTPASNMKVLTSGAALLTLGKDFTFKTEFSLFDAPSGKVLLVKADGDPSFGDPEMLAKSAGKLTLDSLLASIVDAIKKSGVSDFHELVIDDRVFDRTLVHPNWHARHLTEWYGAEVSGLSFHANVLAIFPAPAKSKGVPPILRLEPSVSFVEIENLAKSSPGEPNAVDAERTSDDNRFRVRGEVGQAAQGPLEIPIHDPSLFFAKTLAEELAKSGIRVSSVRTASPNDFFSPDSTRSLAVVTTPIADVIKRTNTNSMNLYAEALLKRMGKHVTKEPGSWSNGSAVLRMTIAERLGPSFAADTVVADGSGLCDENKVAPATITKWLAFLASNKDTSSIFLDSLATPGEGSLKTRFPKGSLKNSLQAKTGYINTVSGLSGYVTHKSGRRVAFSILCNDVPRGDRLNNAIELQRDIVKVIDAWVSRQAKDDPKPESKADIKSDSKPAKSR